jgi:hypothetical protein
MEETIKEQLEQVERDITAGEADKTKAREKLKKELKKQLDAAQSAYAKASEDRAAAERICRAKKLAIAGIQSKLVELM